MGVQHQGEGADYSCRAAGHPGPIDCMPFSPPAVPAGLEGAVLKQLSGPGGQWEWATGCAATRETKGPWSLDNSRRTYLNHHRLVWDMHNHIKLGRLGAPR